MNVVDSCGWLEYIGGGPNADFFAPALEARDGTLAVPTICIYEVFKSLLVRSGQDEALDAAAVMREGTMVPVDHAIAVEAALLARELKLPMADSIILATARSCGALLWTQDAHFKDLEDVRYIEKNAV